MSPGVGPFFEPQGHHWQDLCKASYNVAAYLLYKHWVLRFEKRRFFHMLPIISLWQIMTSLWTPGAWLSGFIRRIS